MAADIQQDGRLSAKIDELRRRRPGQQVTDDAKLRTHALEVGDGLVRRRLCLLDQDRINAQAAQTQHQADTRPGVAAVA